MTRFGYIFDFDGVLVDTMEAHFICYRQALAEVGVPIVKQQFYSQAGMTGREQIQYFADLAGIPVDVEAVYARKRELWSGQPPDVKAIESMLQLVRTLHDAGVPVAVATGSTPPTIVPIMRRLGVVVDVVVTANDVERGKPFPDLFMCAAAKLGLSPGCCIVVEDSDVGVEAAGAAGMQAMRFYDNRDARTQSAADHD